MQEGEEERVKITHENRPSLEFPLRVREGEKESAKITYENQPSLEFLLPLGEGWDEGNGGSPVSCPTLINAISAR